MLTGVSYKCSATSSWKYSTSSSKKYFLPRKRKGESKKTSNSMWTTSRKLSQAIRSSLRTKPKWTFPRMSISSYNWPSRQSSGLGTIQGPFLTGKSTKSLDCWELQSMSSPWCSEIWAKPQALELHSPETQILEKNKSLEKFL